MKKLIFLLLIFVGFSTYAQFRQPGRGIRQSQDPNQVQAAPFEFNPQKVIGITTYDVERAAKKIGLSGNKPEFKSFKDTILKFNKDIKDLSRINSFTFTQVKNNVESAQKLATESRDFSILQNAYKEASETFEPIVKIVTDKEKSLDESLKSFLSKKQFDKWLKYKAKQKTKGN